MAGRFSLKKQKSKKYVPPGKLKERAARKNGSAGYRRAAKIRSSKAWQDCRLRYLKRFPICQWCDNEPAAEVHHIKKLVENPDLAFDDKNLFSVSERCHDLIHARMARRNNTVEKDIRNIKDDR